jgi:hypothetical protein
MYNHCGGDEFFWRLTEGKDGKKGAYLINEILTDLKIAHSECQNFMSSAISFEIAKAHNQVQPLNTEYTDQYSLIETSLKNNYPTANSALSLKAIIDHMPTLSSYKIPLIDYLKYQGQCEHCTIVYAKKTFPFTVQTSVPEKTNNYDVIIVKTFDGR